MENSKLLLNVLKIQAQLKTLHWQTFSHPEHLAFDDTFNVLGGLFDTLIEGYQGKYGRIYIGGIGNIPLMDYTALALEKFISDSANYFNQLTLKANNLLVDSDTDLFVITDEIELTFRKLSYFLTFTNTNG